MTEPRGRKRLILATVASCLFHWTGDGRCDDIQYQTWVDYNPSWRVGEKATVFGDVGLRRNHADPRWWKYVVRPNVGYDLGSWQIVGGVGNFYSDFAGVLHVFELRPWQGVLLNWPASGLKLNHFIRLEERLLFDTDRDNSLFRLRLRYQLGTRVLWRESGSGRSWSSPLSVEAFFQFDHDAEDRFGEQARISAGIERSFSRKLRLRVDVLWQNTVQLTDFYTGNELYLRVRVYQSF